VVQEVLEEVITTNLGLYQVLLVLVDLVAVVVVQLAERLEKLVALVVIGHQQVEIQIIVEVVVQTEEQSLDQTIVFLEQSIHQQ